MIPILHQGLHILALGQREPTADSLDAPDFIAALAAQDDESSALTPVVSAEACLAAGMAMPAQPILATQPILTDPPTTAGLSDIGPSGSVSTAIPAPILEKPLVTAATLAPQGTAAQSIAPAEALDQSTPQSAAINHPAMTVAPMRADVIPPQLQALSNQVSPNHPLEDQAAPKQILPGQIVPDQAEAALPSPLPAQHATNISAAEAAWQTRLQVAMPTKPQPKSSVASNQTLLDAPPPTADSTASAIVAPEPDHSDFKAFVPPLPVAGLAPAPQAADSAKPRQPMADTAPPHQPAPPASARRSSGIAEKPTPDVGATPNAPAAAPDQAMPQSGPDQLSPQANPVAVGPNTLQQTVPEQALPPSPPAIPTQLIRHLAAAQTDAVDVVLQPEELGHVKFQIQQQGESVRILLSAERPETLDLLRRHSDQLLQEFRQSGFSQASLSFGQWGQQQRSPAPPPELVALFDADFVEAPVAPRPPPITAAAASGQGLNLRL